MAPGFLFQRFSQSHTGLTASQRGRRKEDARGLSDECVCLKEGERISFSHLLSSMICHQWSVKGKVERSPVNFLSELKRLRKRQCELLACISL